MAWPAVAPPEAIGWDHIWTGREQIPITKAQAFTLVVADLIVYSPEDGPNARVYRPNGVSGRYLKRLLATL